jgi:hypothetical protein
MTHLKMNSEELTFQLLDGVIPNARAFSTERRDMAGIGAASAD